MKVNENYLKLMKFVSPISQLVFRKKFTNKYIRKPFSNFIEKAQWFDRDNLEQLQVEKLKKRVAHAYKTIPFYKKLMDKHRVSPNVIKDIEDIKKLPIVKKDDLRRHDLMKEIKSKVVKPNETIAFRSSGSTGQPFISLQSKDYVKRFLAYAWLRRFKWAGIPLNFREIVMGNRENVFRYDKFKVTPNMIILDPFKFDEKKVKEFMRLFYAFKPDCLRAYPEVLAQIGRFILKNNLKAHLKSAIIGGNLLIDQDKEVIEKAFQTKVCESYISTEASLMASDCEHNNLHVYMDNVILETLNGYADSKRKSGNVVVTNLDNFAMPFIRYETGDIAKLSDKPCKCGRQFQMISELQGRSSDVVITPSRKFVRLPFFIDLFSKYPDVIRFQVIQEDIDKVLVNLHVKNTFSKLKEEKLFKKLKEVLDNMSLEIRFRDEFQTHTFNKTYLIKNLVRDKILAN